MPAFFYFPRSVFHLLWILAILGACSKSGPNPEPPSTAVPSPPVVINPPVIQPDSLSYLALGDSYTIGQSVPPEDRFPVIAASLLQQKGFKMKAPDIIARTGWSTADLLYDLTQHSIPNNYQLVTLLIGVNNQFRRLPLTDYETEFRQLLQYSVNRAGGNPKRVIVLSIPDYSVTPFARSSNRSLIASEIDLFNERNRNITAGSGISYINITELSRQAGTDKALLTYDSLHYSKKYYKQVAELVVKLAVDKLQ